MTADVPAVVVVGGGISGLATAHRLATSGAVRVTLSEADERLGGNIRTSPFAGLPAVDEAADAFLRRVPDAVELAGRVGLGDALTHPTGATAAVWHDGLHPIPEGLLLGVPGDLRALARSVRSGLLSARGIARAAVEPLLPRRPVEHDSIGRFVRARFGDEVHERLVDALVGSIYAADTDRFSLAAVPQLDALARGDRSVLLGARRARRAAPAPSGPIFAAPAGGMGSFVDAIAESIVRAGGTVSTGSPAERIERDGRAWRVDDRRFDHVVLATPAAATAPLIERAAPAAADALGAVDHVGVVLVTLAVPEWPERLRGRSGYLVPKPDQRYVTAASFGSEKWAHWRPDDGGQVLRVSLGRDGLAVGHLDDDTVVSTVVDEVGAHLDLDLTPTEVRISRWPRAFPQYRPHHADRVAALERALPDGLHVAGASHHGIGIPACVRSGLRAAEKILQYPPPTADARDDG